MKDKNLSSLNIAIGFCTVGLLVVSIFILITTRYQSINENHQIIIKQHIRKIELATNMRESINKRQITLRNLLITTDYFEKDAHKLQFYADAQLYVDARDSIELLLSDDKESQIIKNIRSIAKTGYPIQNELIELGITDASYDKYSKILGQAIHAQTAIKAEIDKLLAHQRYLSQIAAERAENEQKATRTLSYFLGTITLLLLFLIAKITIARTNRQTRKIEELARFPSEDPSPVLRISNKGEILFANAASSYLLEDWQSKIGSQIPDKWLSIIKKLFAEQKTGISDLELKCHKKIYSVNLALVQDKQYINFYGIDITEREKLKQKITHQATHDELTGLVNRREFEHRLQQLIDHSTVENSLHALLYCDLDKFKLVNDSCGHIAGDKLLKQLTGLMSRMVRASDTVARAGGDEFGILLHTCDLNKAQQIAESILETINEFSFVWDNKTYDIGISIGATQISPTSGKIIDVVTAADSACYIAKDTGRNRVYLYQDDDDAILMKRGGLQTIHLINEALANNGFYLFYQKILPLVPNNQNRTHGEILLRMRGENDETIPPSTFIPAAERYDIMINIDKWVVNNSLATIEKHLDMHKNSAFSFSINLSGQSLGHDEFTAFLIDTIESSNVPPAILCFEITETSAIANVDAAIHLITKLRGLGCKFALDDFGSGLSSFNYLKNLNIDYLKIDGSFVKELVNNRVDRSIVEAMNRVGHEMGLKTVAEFVENNNIAQALKAIGVDYGQGYGMHKPESLDDVLQIVSSVKKAS